MKTAITEMLGIDIPLLAFSHCRDVVAAVSSAGGFGMLGASSRTPEQLEEELDWIDRHTGGKPYGVDIIVAEKYVGQGQSLTEEQFATLIPAEHREYVARLLTDHGIPTTPDEAVRLQSLKVSAETGAGSHGEQQLSRQPHRRLVAGDGSYAGYPGARYDTL